YGRRTGQWQLEPLSYPYLRRFLPYDEEELVMTWCAIGGVPAYLRLFRPDRTFWENVEEQILRKGAYLYSEAEILMQYEFREAGNYMAILRALAAGYTTSASLCQGTGLDKGLVSKYLAVLSRMHLIRDEVPVTAHAGYRRRHYRLTDPYLRFWFRFVYPRRAETETGQSGEVLASIREEIAPYCGEMFEQLALDLVRRGILFGSSYSRLGRWWQKETEIDLVGLNEVSGDALFCECKWSVLNRRQARGILAALREKASMVRWRNESRNERFALVAKSIEGKEDLREDGYLVCDLEDIARLSREYLAGAGG
ncbi:ATP-binding protein, partial [Methanoculleus sp.]